VADHATQTRHLLLVLAAAGALIPAMALFSGAVEAAPFSVTGSVTGEIQDMWLNPDSCCFEVHISWSDVETWNGLTVEAVPLFLDESTGSYVMEASSRGWRVGDTVNVNMTLGRDEWGSIYMIYLSVKSDENFAEPQSFVERNPFFIYTIAAIAILVLLVVIRRLVFKGRTRFESDARFMGYLRFFKRM
jgi:hypothetical protein